MNTAAPGASLWEEFVAHRGWIECLCRRYLWCVCDSEDAVQEVACRVLTAAAMPDHPRAWLRTVAAHICLNMIRASDHAKPIEDEPGAKRSGALTRLKRDEARAQLRDRVLGLPDELAEVVWLIYGPSRTSRRVAARVLGVPEAAVKWRVERALELLRKEGGGPVATG